VLLIILGLMAMFGMVAMAFLLVTGQSRRAADAQHRIDQYTSDAEDDADRAAMQVFRGAEDRASALWSHSLLEDEYGERSVTGYVAVYNVLSDPDVDAKLRATKPSLVVGGLDPQVQQQLPQWNGERYDPETRNGGQLFEFTPNQGFEAPHQYVGCVLTVLMTSGDPVSTRIVGVRQAQWRDTAGALHPVFWDPSTNQEPAWRVKAVAQDELPRGPDGKPGIALVDDDGSAPADNLFELSWPFVNRPYGNSDDLRPGDPFVINGLPFTGTGVGFQPESGMLDLVDRNGRPLALLPRAFLSDREYERWLYGVWDAANGRWQDGICWMNGQDAIAQNADDRRLPGPDNTLGTRDDQPWPRDEERNEDYDAADYQNMVLAYQENDGTVPIPSLHRPALVHYWFSRMAQLLQTNYGLTAGDAWNVIHYPFGPDGRERTADDTAWLPAPDAHVVGQMIADLKRRILLRPLTEDHRDFSGGNLDSLASQLSDPNTGQPLYPYWLLDGDWDVDNDGDGEPDSLWVDAGFPVRTTPDGRDYKPLAAVLCVDQDGRVNLNAAGSTAQLNSLYDQQITGPYPKPSSVQPPQPVQPVNLPRGQGCGPADMRLSQVLPQAEVATVFQGSSVWGFPGRYGESTNGTAQAGLTGTNDALSRVSQFEYPANYTNFGNPPTLTAFASPPDLWGRMATGLDYRGQPLFWKQAWASEILDDPYELNLDPSSTGGNVAVGSTYDRRFTVYDMERLLRPFDVDAARLPYRLLGLAPSLDATASDARYSVTAESWHVPSLYVSLPPELQDPLSQLVQGHEVLVQQAFSQGLITQAQSNYLMQWLTRAVRNMTQLRHIRELYAVRVYLEQGPAVTAPADVPNLLGIFRNIDSGILMQTVEGLSRMVPWETLAGLPMDVNRPLGNGRDDPFIDTDNDGIPDAGQNGVVDEPSESVLVNASGQPIGLGEFCWGPPSGPFSSATAFQLNAGVDVDGDGNGNGASDQYLARHLYARHLFMLAMLLRDDVDTNGDGIPDSGYAMTQNTDDATDFPVGSAENEELTVRRLAQWAVNAVDFRDADSIMTPFEYDMNPFNGWTVDGIVGTADDDTASNPDRRLVWGCESPDLLLTSTLAFHDCRVADTAWDDNEGKTCADGDNDGNPDDDDLDQPRIPQGAAFFELYCTSNDNNRVAPPDLYSYDPSTQRWFLDLNRLAPSDANGRRYPVWRMAITETGADNNVGQRLWQRPDSTSLEPRQSRTPIPTDNFSLLEGSSEPNVAIDRLVWFTTQAPSGHQDADRVYYNRSGVVRLASGQYLVVGPRDVTPVGAIDPASNNNTYGKPAPQEVGLSPVSVTTVDGLAVSPLAANGEIKAPAAMVVAGPPPPTWTNAGATAPNGIGISISEPLFSSGYYAEPDEPNPATGQIDAYGDLAQQDNSKLFRDVPEDSVTGRPLADIAMRKMQTTVAFKTVFLQRLANPLAPYDPVTNPYRSVDWMPIDLTVFNGEHDGILPDYDPISNPTAAEGIIRFDARQRGELQFNAPQEPGLWTSVDFNLWKQISELRVSDTYATNGVADPAETQDHPDAGTDVVFKHALFDARPHDPAVNLPAQLQPLWRYVTPHPSSGNQVMLVLRDPTLGYINEAFHETYNRVTNLSQLQQPAPPRPWLTSNEGVAPKYYGDPKVEPFRHLDAHNQVRPYPWLTWNNRPYVSSLETLLVPNSSPARLLHELTLRSPDDPYMNATEPNSSYEDLNRDGILNGSEDQNGNNKLDLIRAASLPFGQLPNVFHDVDDPTGTAPTDRSPHLYRLLEYLRVPSRFVGTETVGNPAAFVNRGDAHTQLVRPPFNMLSNYREPGRVNLNTMTNQPVWDAVQNGHSSAAWSDVQGSRRGYTASGLDPNYPTQFANPFRSSGGRWLVPLSGLPSGIDMRNKGVSVGLLRAAGVDADGGTAPLFANSFGEEYQNTDRNPYFRYQDIHRLENLVTTRSNVFAVWITMGYFEVQPRPTRYYWDTVNQQWQEWTPEMYRDVYPDGFALGNELGTDTGDIERHRAFYIFDRSVPVGFERGEDHNVENAILLKRFIE
jgi:hypothetical protein